MDVKNRKEEIPKLIQRGLNNVKSLANHFGVSLMTIYRDVRELEKEGKIIRKHGELVIKDEVEIQEETKDVCAFCEKIVDKRLEFVYITTRGRRIKACCAHCGLLLYRNFKEEEIQSCITKDFISGNPISCFSAYYVIGTSVTPCCSPPVIAFAKEEDAQKFKKGFDGVVASFEDAVKIVEDLMKKGQPVKLSL